MEYIVMVIAATMFVLQALRGRPWDTPLVRSACLLTAFAIGIAVGRFAARY